MNRHKLSFDIGIIGGFTLLSMILTYPLILHLTTHIPFDGILPPSISEHWISMWGFWFIKHVVVEGGNGRSPPT